MSRPLPLDKSPLTNPNDTFLLFLISSCCVPLKLMDISVLLSPCDTEASVQMEIIKPWIKTQAKSLKPKDELHVVAQKPIFFQACILKRSKLVRILFTDLREKYLN